MGLNAEPESPLIVDVIGSRQIRRNVAATMIGRAISVATNFASTLLIIRALPPSGYGMFLVVLNVVTLLDMSGEISLFEIAVREIAKLPQFAHHWIGAATSIRFALAILASIAMLAFVGLAHPDPVIAATARVSVAYLILSSLRTPVTYFRAGLMIHWEVGFTCLARLLELGMVLLLTRYHPTPPALMGAKAIASGFFVLSIWIVMLRKFRVKFVLGQEHIGKLAGYSIPVGITALLMLVQLKGDIVLIGWIRGPWDAGAFGAVAQLPELAIVTNSIMVATVGPLLARTLAQRDGAAEFSKIFQNVFDELIRILPGMALVTSIAAAPLIHIVLGNKYPDITVQFRILVWVSAWIPIAGLLGISAITLNLQKLLVKVELVNSILYIAANVLLLRWGGTIVSAWIRLGVIAIGSTWTYRIIRRNSINRLSFSALPEAAGAALVSGLVAAVLAMTHPMLGFIAGVAVQLAVLIVLKSRRRGLSAPDDLKFT